MSELTQAERIAALKAKRAASAQSPSPSAQPAPRPPAIPTVGEPVVVVQAVPQAPSLDYQVPARDVPVQPVITRRRGITIAAPAPQRLVAAGASIVSFAAITVAMGPLTTQSVETTAAAEVPETAPGDELGATVVPPAAPEVVVEVIPKFFAVSPDGTPLPDVELLPDGTPVVTANTAELVVEESPVDLTATASAPATPAAAAPAAKSAPVAPAPAPTAPAAPAPTAPPVAATPVPAAAAPTAAPAAAAPATTAAPAAPPPTTAAPAPTAAPTTVAPPPPPPTAAPPPPPKSDGSG